MSINIMKILLLRLVCIVTLSSTSSLYAQTSTVSGPEFLSGSRFRLNSQDTIYLTEFGGSDIGIINSSDKDLLVPNNSQIEIDAFLLHMSSEISVCNRQDGGWSEIVTSYCRCSPSIVSARSRTCTNPEPSCGGSCDGLLEEVTHYVCPMIACPPGPGPI